LLAYRLATLHNLTFLYDLMENIRQSIASGTFEAYKKAFLDRYQTTNEQVRISQKSKWLKARGSQE
jgi:queuine tRNA-ribosyltransferase